MPRLPRALKVEIADEDLELNLRLLQHSDDQALTDAINAGKSHLAKYLDWAEGKYGVVEANEFIATARRHWQKKTGFGFGVFHEQDLVGHIMIHDLDIDNKKNRDEDKAEIGYWISSDWTRKGIATAALKRMIDFAFEELALPRLKLVARSVNQGSNRVAEKAGFKKVRDYRDSRLKFNEYILENDNYPVKDFQKEQQEDE